MAPSPAKKTLRFTSVVTRQSTTPEGVASKVNSLLGKKIQSPRDDYRGEVEVFDIRSLQVIKISPKNWYGIAVVEVGVRKERLNVERAFFDSVPSRVAETL